VRYHSEILSFSFGSANNMLRLIASVLVGVLLASEAHAAPACPLPDKQNVSYAELIALQADLPDEIIAYGDDQFQFGELWIPKEATPTRKAPLVVFAHGGCWLNAYSIDHSRVFSNQLARAGYAVWSIEYRRTGDAGGGWPGSYQDILRGLNHVANLSDPRIDRSMLAITGHSAGGHLVLLAATDRKLRIEPQVVIGLAPIVNIATYAAGENSCQIATPHFMGGTPAEIAEDYRAANPSTGKFRYPVLSIHGTADAIVPLQQSTDLLETRIVEGAGHFDLIHPHTPAFQTLLKSLAEFL
jgi:acetyl esterase/lipase